MHVRSLSTQRYFGNSGSLSGQTLSVCWGRGESSSGGEMSRKNSRRYLLTSTKSHHSKTMENIQKCGHRFKVVPCQILLPTLDPSSASSPLGSSATCSLISLDSLRFFALRFEISSSSMPISGRSISKFTAFCFKTCEWDGAMWCGQPS